MLIEEFIVERIQSRKNYQRTVFETNMLMFCYMATVSRRLSPRQPRTIDVLSIPVKYNVKEIPSGCCGMAGSFGYEEEHFDLSNKIGEMVLFPEVRDAAESDNNCSSWYKLQASY